VEDPAKPSVPTPPPPAEENHTGLGDDIVVVATYDGKWKPVDDSKK
jgi:hypothetical protein